MCALAKWTPAEHTPDLSYSVFFVHFYHLLHLYTTHLTLPHTSLLRFSPHPLLTAASCLSLHLFLPHLTCLLFVLTCGLPHAGWFIAVCHTPGLFSRCASRSFTGSLSSPRLACSTTLRHAVHLAGLPRHRSYRLLHLGKMVLLSQVDNIAAADICLYIFLSGGTAALASPASARRFILPRQS